MNRPQATDTKPWYQHFWPVFIVGIMSVVIIACLFMVKLAVEHPDPVVEGDYYKQGLTINQRLPDDLLEKARAEQEAHQREAKEAIERLRAQLEAEQAAK